MGWIITLAVVTGIFLIPVGVSLLYEKKKFTLRIRVAKLNFTLNLNENKNKEPDKKQKIPKSDPDPETSQEKVVPENILDKKMVNLQKAREKRKQAKQETKEAEIRARAAEKKLEQHQKAQEESLKPQKPKKTDVRIYFPFIRLAWDFLSSLRRKLRIEKLYIKVTLAGDDPCDLAQNYGRIWAGASTLLGHINQAFIVEDQDLNIQCDFMAEKTDFSGRLDLTLTIGRILSLALLYGARALKEFFVFKKRKGGAVI